MSKEKGYIKIYRDMLNNPIVCKDSDHIAVWMYLLLNASHSDRDVTFGGQRLTLAPGQLTTGRKVIAEKLNISESKVQRILKLFENEHQIEQRTDHQCRLISICSWNEYQCGEQRNEQQVNNDRTTSEQRVNTKQKRKELKNEIIKENCSSKEQQDPLWKRLTTSDFEELGEKFWDVDELISAVSKEVKERHREVEHPFNYILGYAVRVGWPRKIAIP